MSKSEKLRLEGSTVARGVLSLERDAAKQKLGMFSLPDPHFWVLQIVRAAVVAGATSIDFRVSATDVKVVFDAKLNAPLLRNLWNVALEDRVSNDRVALHYVALGLSAARSFNPKLMSVDTDGGVLTIHPDAEYFQPGAAQTHTEIIVEEELRFGHLLEFFDTILGRSAEERALLEYADLAPIQIVANGKPLSANGLTQVEGEPTVRGYVANIAALNVVVLRHGIRVGSKQRKFEPVGGLIAHENDDLPVNLSTLSLAALPWEVVCEMTDHYLGLLKGRVVAGHYSPLVQLSVIQLAAQSAAEHEKPKSTKAFALVEFLLDAPIFPPVGRYATHGSSLRAAMRDGAIEFARSPIPEVKAAELEHIIMADNVGELMEDLPKIGFPCRDMTAHLQATRLRTNNLQRFSRQPPREPGSASVRTVGSFSGWVELAQDLEGVVEFCIDRRTIRIEPLMLPIRVVVDGPFETNLAFDDIEPAEEVLALSRLLCEEVRSLWTKALPWQAIEFADQVISGRFEKRLFEGLRATENIEGLELPDTAEGWLEQLGAIADQSLIDLDAGGKTSLRAILEAPEAPVFGPANELAIPLSADRIIIMRATPLGNLLTLLRPSISGARNIVDREAARRRFQRQELFRPLGQDAPFDTEKTLTGLRMRLQLRGRDERPTADVKLIYEGRLLARHVWEPVIGTWDVAIWCDALRPNDSYTDVARDATLQRCVTTFREFHEAALHDWWHECVRYGRLDSTLSELFAEVSRHFQLPEDALILGKQPVAPAPPRPAGTARTAKVDPSLAGVYDTLERAREGHRELISDHMLWRVSVRQDNGPWHADESGATLGRDHPLAQRTTSQDPVVLAFLASTAATAVNAYYREFTDTDELRLQHNLLKLARE